MNNGFASSGQRLGAYMIDALIGFVIWGSFFGIALATDSQAVAIAYYPVIVAYGVILWALIATKGYTPGKQAVGIRVVDAESLQPIGWGRAFLRNLVFVAEGMFCGIPLLITGILSGSHPRRQTWHDMAATSVVMVKASVTAGPTPAAPPQPAPSSASAPPLPPTPAPPLGSAMMPPTPVDVAPRVAAAPLPPSPGLVGPPPGGMTSPPPPSPPVDLAPAPAPIPQPPMPASAPPVPPAVNLPPVPPPTSEGSEPVDEHTRAVRPRPVGWTLRDARGSVELAGAVLAGRDPDTALVDGSTAWALDDPERTVSKTHALFGLDGGIPFVEDWASTNGIILRRNGVETELASRAREVLEAGDELLLGEYLIRLETGQ